MISSPNALISSLEAFSISSSLYSLPGLGAISPEASSTLM